MDYGLKRTWSVHGLDLLLNVATSKKFLNDQVDRMKYLNNKKLLNNALARGKVTKQNIEIDYPIQL